MTCAGGWTPELYSASEQLPDGVLVGYWPVLLGQCDPAYAMAMGLPYSAAQIPPFDVRLAWIIENGSYVSGFPGYIAQQGFNPRAPLANPAALMGVPPNARAATYARLGQGLLLAAKAAAAAIGAGATVVSALALVSTMGGTIGAMAATVLSTIGSAVGIVGAATAAATGTAAAAGAVVAGAVALPASVVPATAGALSTAAATGVGAIPAVIAAVLLAIGLELVAAFGAEDPSAKLTYVSKATQIRICYREAGALRGVVFVNQRFFLDPAHPPAVPEAPIAIDPAIWGSGNQANIENVDAETFFAGLVYLRPSSEHGWFGGIVDIGIQKVLSPSLDLLWTQRVSDEGIAAFRAARDAGSAISDAIAAAAAFPIRTPFQEWAAGKITPQALAFIPGNAQALPMLADHHRKNEATAAASLATVPADIRVAFGVAAGLARPHLMPATRAIAQAIGLFDAHIHAKAAVAQAAKGIAVVTPRAKGAVQDAAKKIQAPPARSTRSLTTGPPPHPIAVLGSGALCGVAGFYLAPTEYRLPAAGAAAIAGLLLTRFVH